MADIVARRLFEAHLAVADLARSTAFYRDVVGLQPALEIPERGAAFLWIGDPGTAMLGLWSLGSAPLVLQSHLAFAVTAPELAAAPSALQARGVQPLSFSGEPADEPSVLAWMPAAAVYFRDPDGHLLEYLAMLDDAPQPELGILGWSAYAPLRRAAAARVVVHEHRGDRSELRPLFALAEDSDAQLESYLHEGRVLVATDGGRVVGHLQLVVDEAARAAEIKNMAVEPARRRQGVGRALADAAIDAARAAGCTQLDVATATADIGNLRFYQRLGFRLRSVEPDAFTAATGYDDVVVDGIPLRDRVWLRRTLGAPEG
jgi:lactoylglutathione lyase